MTRDYQVSRGPWECRSLIAALAAQDTLEIEGAKYVDETLIAYQEYLQLDSLLGS